MDVRRVLVLQGLLYINCVAGLHETELLETLRNLEKTRYLFFSHLNSLIQVCAVLVLILILFIRTKRSPKHHQTVTIGIEMLGTQYHSNKSEYYAFCFKEIQYRSTIVWLQETVKEQTRASELKDDIIKRLQERVQSLETRMFNPNNSAKESASGQAK